MLYNFSKKRYQLPCSSPIKMEYFTPGLFSPRGNGFDDQKDSWKHWKKYYIIISLKASNLNCEKEFLSAEKSSSKSSSKILSLR